MSIQILDVYWNNKFDIDVEKATGTDGIIFRAGWGRTSDMGRIKQYLDRCDSIGMPWGLYWHVNGFYSPESHIEAIKNAIPDKNFGKLGFWLDCEKPFIGFPDRLYSTLPYGYYKPIEKIWRAVNDWCGIWPGIYTNKGFWDLAFGKIPTDIAIEMSVKSKLWVAQYKTVQPSSFGFWITYFIWQYQGEPDYSIFNGTDEQWYEFINQPAPEPLPEPEPIPEEPPVIPPTSGTITNIEVEVVSDNAALQKVTVDGTDYTSITTLSLFPLPDDGTGTIPPQDNSRLGTYQILHDWQMPEKYWGGMSRTASPKWTGRSMTPETVRISGSRSSIVLSMAAQKLVETLNPNTLKYIKGQQHGWVNYGKWPKVECLTFSGNIVDVIAIDESRNRAYIRTWKGETDDPCVIHRWVNVDNKGKLYDTGRGEGFIVLAYTSPVWIELDKLVKIS
jgi:hypothetical protein